MYIYKHRQELVVARKSSQRLFWLLLLCGLTDHFVLWGKPRSQLETLSLRVSYPREYQTASHHPVLRGEGHCPHRLCAPVIALPPDFLQGSCSPHPANDEKRYRLYRLHWRVLNDLNLWCDDEYLQRNQAHIPQYTTKGKYFPIVWLL